MSFTFYLPSFYGDVRLVSTGKKTCVVHVEQATYQEQQALAAVQNVAVKKGWISPKISLLSRETAVNAPIEKVAKLIAKALKPGKQLVSAVKFSNGKIEEVHEASFEIDELANARGKEHAPPKPEPEKATTVAAPTRGCPEPDFPPARLRAREVLFAFLTEEQRRDFDRHNRFVTVGGTTGHRYMVSSRHALNRRFSRSLFDLDDDVTICTHDHDVPPEEEMHALNILVQLPGHEQWMRTLPSEDR